MNLAVPCSSGSQRLDCSEADRAGDAFNSLLLSGDLDLPLPGSGRTAARWRALARIAAVDLSVARLAEGHTDACAILAEAGRRPTPSGRYGVWSARSDSAEVLAERSAGGWVLQGRKEFASGATTLSHALVTAQCPDGQRLFEVPTDRPGVRVAPDTWPSVGMAGSDSGVIEFDTVFVGADATVGGLDFYIHRAGFAMGGVGVAAVWYGAAAELVEDLRSYLVPNRVQDVGMVRLGLALSAISMMRCVLEASAARFDADPQDRSGTAEILTLQARIAIHRGCTEVLEHVAAAGGPRVMCTDRARSRRFADLGVYLAQQHPDHAANSLARSATSKLGQW